MAKTSEIWKVLKEDIENKKPFTSAYDMDCYVCSNEIMEGDEFFFMGAKRKVCNNCLGDMIDAVENL